MGLFIQSLILLACINFCQPNPTNCEDPPQLPPLVSDISQESSKILPGKDGEIRAGLLGINPYYNISYEDVPDGLITKGMNRAHCSVKSTCQWHYVYNVDPNRKPKTIIEAKCSHHCCKRHGHNCCPSNGNPLPGCHSCQPIYYYTHVLRRTGCSGRYYTYRSVLEKIVAGCTCVKTPTFPTPQRQYMPV